jgi:hypothetical protein
MAGFSVMSKPHDDQLMNHAHHNQGQKLRWYGRIVPSICFCEPFMSSVELTRLLHRHRRCMSLTALERFPTGNEIPAQIQMETSVLKFPLYSLHGYLCLLHGVS